MWWPKGFFHDIPEKANRWMMPPTQLVGGRGLFRPIFRGERMHAVLRPPQTARATVRHARALAQGSRGFADAAGETRRGICATALSGTPSASFLRRGERGPGGGRGASDPGPEPDRRVASTPDRAEPLASSLNLNQSPPMRNRSPARKLMPSAGNPTTSSYCLSRAFSTFT